MYVSIRTGYHSFSSYVYTVSNKTQFKNIILVIIESSILYHLSW